MEEKKQEKLKLYDLKILARFRILIVHLLPLLYEKLAVKQRVKENTSIL